MNTNIKTARIAGVCYAGVTFFGIFAEVVRSNLVVAGDAAATARNILASEFLFRLGFVSDLFMMTGFLVLPLVLYQLFNRVHKNLSLLMVIFVVVSIPMNMLNLLNEYNVLHLLTSSDFLGAFGQSQVYVQAMLSFEAYKSGYYIAQIFFGLWLLPLGLLVYKSKFLPGILGVLLIAACGGHLLGVFTHFLLPGIEWTISLGDAVAAVGEMGFLLWILIRGINESKIKSDYSITAAS